MKRIDVILIEQPGETIGQLDEIRADVILTTAGNVIKNVFGPTGTIRADEPVQTASSPEEQSPVGHPFCDGGGERSAKVAAAHVYQLLIGYGLSAKTAASCAYAVATELEDKGEY